MKKLFKFVALILSGFIIGIFAGYTVFYNSGISKNLIKPIFVNKIVIGFLPYWLLGKAKIDYSSYITQLAYFDLSIGPDGRLVKLQSPGVEEPGWAKFQSGAVDSYLSHAKTHSVTTALVTGSGDQAAIASLIRNPISNARNLLEDVNPIIKQKGFSNLNLDIEYTGVASDQARTEFVQFVKTVRLGLLQNTTLTVDVSPEEFVSKGLIDPQAIGKIVDYELLMTYDYHSTASFVTGPVAPLAGAGISSEYDVATTVQKALKYMPSSKIILGIPLYGYEWETFDTSPRSMIIPNTGVIASNNRVTQLVKNCASCSAHFDTVAKEEFIEYKDPQTGDYHQIFYPDSEAMQAKLNFADSMGLSGVGLWALGYEGPSLLNPLTAYKQLLY